MNQPTIQTAPPSPIHLVSPPQRHPVGLYTLFGNIHGAQGRNWFPCLPALLLTALVYAPQALTRLGRHTNALAVLPPSRFSSKTQTYGRLRYRSATSSPYPMTKSGGIRKPT